MAVKKVDHIAIVVSNIENALTLYQDVLGLSPELVTEDPVEQVRIAYIPTPEGMDEIELVEPMTTDSGIAKFLDKRGEGLHHVCVEVECIEETVEDMTARGLNVLGQIRTNQRGDRYIFIHPKSAHGVLLELYERATPQA
ncbi:MAG: VOC family protein [Chloroflexota bacterium]